MALHRDPFEQGLEPKRSGKRDSVTSASEKRSRHPQELDTSIWAVEEALQRFDGDDAFLREMAELFLIRSQQLLAMLEQAVAAGDVLAVKGMAHALKGSAAELSAKEVVETARRLEETARDNELSELVRQTQALQQAALCLHEVMGAWLDSQSATGS